MASFQKTLNLDVLNVKAIVPKAANNATIPQYAVLTSDSNGGTTWTSTFVGDGRRVQFVTAVALSTNTNYTIESGAFTAGSFIGDGSRVANVVATGLSTGVDYQIGSGSLTASTLTAHYFYGDGSQLINVVGNGLRVGSNYNIGEGSFQASTFTAERFVGNTFTGIAQSASNAGITSNLVYSNTYYMSSLNINQTINPPVIPTMVTPQPGINLYVRGGTYLNGPTFMLSNTWQYDTNGNQRILYGIQNPGFDTTFGSPDGYVWNNYKANLDPTEVMRLTSTGTLSVSTLVNVPSLTTGLITGLNIVNIPIFAVSTIAGQIGTGSANGNGTNAQFNRPHGVKVDLSGNLFVADSTNHRIRMIYPNGAVSTIAGSSAGNADGNGTNARFRSPRGIALDLSGNLFVADSTNHRIRMIYPNGAVSTIAGQIGTGNADGNGTNAQFNNPQGIHIDLSGNLYIADSNNNIIRKIYPNGAVSTIAGQIGTGYADGNGTNAQFNNPYGIILDLSGNLVVTDTSNNLIRKIYPGGEVSTIAGSSLGTADGNGTNARFNQPSGITMDLSGNLFVTDNANNLIRKIYPDGEVTTITGQVIGGFADGNGTNALFRVPRGIHIDLSGNLYVGDAQNNLIRKINITTFQSKVNTLVVNASIGVNCNAPQYTFDVNGNANISGNINTATGSISSLRVSSLTGGTSQLSIAAVSSLTVSSMTVATGSISSLAVSSFTAGLSQVNIERVSSLNVSSMLTADASISTLRVSSLTAGLSQVSLETVSSLRVSSMTVATGSISSLAVSSFTAETSQVLFESISSLLVSSMTVARGSISTLVVSTMQAGATQILNETVSSLIVSTMELAIGSISSLTVSSLTAGVVQILDETVSSLAVSTIVVNYGSISSLKVSSLNTGLSEVSIERVSSLTVSSMMAGYGSISSLNVSSLLTATGSISSLNVSSLLTATGLISSLTVSSFTAGTIVVPTVSITNYTGVNITVDNILTKTLVATTFTTSTMSASTISVSSLQAGLSQVSLETVSSLTVSSMWVADGSISTLRVSSLTAGLSQVSLETVSSLRVSSMAVADGSISTLRVSSLTAGLTQVSIANTSSLNVSSMAVADASISSLRVSSLIAGTSQVSIETVSSLTVSTLACDTSYMSNAFISSLTTGVITGSNSQSFPIVAVSTFAGKTIGTADGNGTNAQFNFPTGITADLSGNIFVADINNHQIRKIYPNGAVSTFAGKTYGYANGNGTNAQFKAPYGITADLSGNIFVADTGNHLIRKIYPGGEVSTIAGQITLGTADGNGTNAQFNTPLAITVDLYGNLYVGDSQNNLIRKIYPGGEVSTIAGKTTLGTADGNGTNAQFRNPQGITADLSGNIFVADTDNHRIRKIYPNGAVSTFAGQNSGTLDGNGTNAQFNFPIGITIDLSGNLFIADIGNNLIRKIYPGGAVSTLAGKTSGTADGNGTNAQFNAPRGITVDLYGDLFVSDNGNHLIRKIATSFQSTLNTLVVNASIGVNCNAPQYTLDVNGSFNALTGSIATLQVSSLTAGLSQVSIANTSSLNVSSMAVADGSISTLRVSSLTAGLSEVSIERISSLTVSSMAVADASISTLRVSSLTAGLSQVSIERISSLNVSSMAVADGSISTLRVSSLTAGLSQLSIANTSSLNVSSMAVADGSISTLRVSSLTADLSQVSREIVSSLTVSSMLIAAGSIMNLDVLTLNANTSYMSNAFVPSLTTGLITGSNSQIFPIVAVSTFAGKTIGTADGNGTNAQFSTPRGIAVDLNGNLFVADSFNHLIRKIYPGGEVSTFAGKTAGAANGNGTNAQFNNPVGITIDLSGNLFVAEGYNHLIRKIYPGGEVSTIAGIAGSEGYTDGNGTYAQFRAPEGIAVDLSGNLFIADTYNSAIRKIYPGGEVSTLAGIGYSGTANGNGTNAQFNKPRGIVVDLSGNLFVADTENHLIRKIYPGGEVSTFAGKALISGTADGNGTNAQFNQPNRITIDLSGNLFVADIYNNVIRKIYPGGEVSTLAGKTIGNANGNGTNAQFNIPTGIAVDLNGNLFVADSGNNIIRKIATSFQSTLNTLVINASVDVNGSFNALTGSISSLTTGLITGSNSQAFPIVAVSTFAGIQGSPGTNDGNGTNAQFRLTLNLAIDTSGNLFVADANNNLIRKVYPGGEVSTIAGKIQGTNDGNGTNAQFNFPNGIAVDSIGNVFIADASSNIIRKIYPNGAVSTIAGKIQGTNDGNGTNAQFNNPRGLAVDMSGNLFVTDGLNNLIRKIYPGGEVSTIAGKIQGTNDGNGTNAQFYFPNGIKIDTSGNLFVVDTFNHLIRKIYPGGAVTTIAGKIQGTNDGNGTNAQFKNPYGIAIDTSGIIFIADNGNDLIRKIYPDGTVTTIAGKIQGLLDGNGTNAQFNYPRGIAVDSNGNLFIGNQHSLRKINTSFQSTVNTLFVNANNIGVNCNAPQYTLDVNGSFNALTGSISTLQASSFTTTTILDNGTTVKVVNTLAGSMNSGTADGQGTNSTFFKPNSVAVAADGTLYVADGSNNMIRTITPSGLVQTLAGSPTSGTADGQGTIAKFFTPNGIALDLSGNVYVADSANNKIRAITPGGLVTTLAGGTAAGFFNDVGTNALFNLPIGITASVDGNLYVADGINNVIRAISLTTKQVTTLAGGTSAGFVNDSGTNARFNQPRGLIVNLAGDTVYVGDRDNNCVRKITVSNSNVTTLAGGSSQGYLDGVGTNALFNQVRGLGVDSIGNVYVADHGNNRIRIIDTASNVTTMAGDGSIGSLNSVAPTASFYSPWAVAVGLNNAVYVVADQNNNMIRAITNQNVLNLSAAVGVNCNVPQYNLDVNGTISGVAATFSNMYTLNATISSLSVSTLVGYTSGVSTFSTLYTSSLSGNAIISNPQLVPYGFTSTINITQYNFPSPVNVLPTVKGIAADSYGTLYIADQDNPVITTISTNGVASILANVVTGGQDIVLYNGFAYYANSGSARIDKINLTTRAVTVFAGSPTGLGGFVNNVVGTNARFNYPCQMAFNTARTILYVTDYSNNQIRQIDMATSNVTTFIGGGGTNNSGLYLGQGTNALFTGFHGCQGITVDTSDNVFYIMGRSILKITPSGIPSIFAGNPTITGYNDGIGTNALFSGAIHLSIDQNNNIYVSEELRVRMITPAGVVTTVAGGGDKGILKGYVDGVAGNAALFGGLWAILYNTYDNLLYVGDYNNTTIRTIQTQNTAPLITNPLLLNPLSGNVGINTDNPQYTLDVNGNANFNGNVLANSFCDCIIPVASNTITLTTVDNNIESASRSLVIAPNGTIYSVSSYPRGVFRIFNNNTVIYAGTGGFGFTDGFGTNASFNFPYGLAIDSLGSNLYVADDTNRNIRVINLSNAYVSTLAGPKSDVTAGTTDGTGINARFTQPFSLAIDQTNTNLYVGDYNVIRRINLTTTLVSIVAGSVTQTSGTTDGIGTNASFNNIYGIAIDKTNTNLYISDTFNNKIRVMNLATSNVSTVAGAGGGTGCNASGYTDAVGIQARFSLPYSIAFDSTYSNLYIADFVNTRVRKLNIATQNVTTYTTNLFGGIVALDVAENDAVYLIQNIYPQRISVLTPTVNNYVGINCNAPGYTLDVNGSMNVASGLTVPNGSIKGVSITDYVGTNTSYPLITDLLNRVGMYIFRDTSATASIYFNTFNNPNCNTSLYLKYTGNVGINCNAPAYTLDVNGAIRASGDIIAFSDQRVKTDIVTIDSALDKVNALRGVYYNRTDTDQPTLRHMGVIAQEVEQVLPEVVKTDSTEGQMKSVAYGNIVGVLIESIKELTQRLAPVETLSTQVAMLQWQNMCLQSTVGSLMMR